MEYILKMIQTAAFPFDFTLIINYAYNNPKPTALSASALYVFPSFIFYGIWFIKFKEEQRVMWTESVSSL